MASSIVPFAPNEKDDGLQQEVQQKLDDYWKYQREKYEEQQEHKKLDWYERMPQVHATRIALELKLLNGAISFDAILPASPPQQLEDPASSRPVLTNCLTKDGCIDHSLVSACAVHELYALALDIDGLFWTNDGLLNQQHYQQTFPRLKSLKRKRTSSSTPDDANSSTWTHASRASAIVKMEHTRLANKFTFDNEEWERLFPSIVSKSRGLRFLSQQGSLSRNLDESVQLIQIQLQATTPLVPERNFVILRTCKKIDPLTWVVADVSVDSTLNVGYPCGCLIQGMADGSSQVTWVEHLEFKESYLDPKFYNDLCCRGFAFGAERWVACLERFCERRSYNRSKSDFKFVPRVVGQDRLDYEKKCVMSFSKMMIRDFCLNIGPPIRQSHRSSCVSAPCQSCVSLEIKKSPYHDDPREMVLLATTTFSLPQSPDFVLKILGDERRRQELDASGRIGPLKEVACYITGDDPRNKISVQANLSFGNELLLQETSVSRAGALVVWSLLRSELSRLVRLVEDVDVIPLIGLSGVAISSNSHQNSSNTCGGSFVTLGLQQEARHIQGLWPKLIECVKKCMQDTVSRIVEVLNNSEDEGDRCSTNKRKAQDG